MNEITFLSGIIEGLPASYDATYVIRTEKKCFVSNIQITADDINENKVIYIDGFGFSLKDELNKNNMNYSHLRDGDKSSPVKLLRNASF